MLVPLERSITRKQSTASYDLGPIGKTPLSGTISFAAHLTGGGVAFYASSTGRRRAGGTHCNGVFTDAWPHHDGEAGSRLGRTVMGASLFSGGPPESSKPNSFTPNSATRLCGTDAGFVYSAPCSNASYQCEGSSNVHCLISFQGNAGLAMSEPNHSPKDFIPFDEMEERELRRSLLSQSRTGDAVAQAKLFALYGVRVSSPTAPET